MSAPLLRDLDPRVLTPGRHAGRYVTAPGGGDLAGCDVVVLVGDRPGPTVLAIGAVHGDEYEGPAALARLATELEPTALAGRVVLVPVANEPAHYATRRENPADRQNLARVFPGRADGTVTEQLAHSLTCLMGRTDALLDLHAAGTFYTLHPWAGYGMVDDPAVLDRQRAMATAFGLDFVWGTPMAPGRSLSAAADLGLPAIYVEMTGAGLCREPDVETDRQGVVNVLRCLGVLAGEYPTVRPRYWRESREPDEGHLQVDHPAPRRGLFRPLVELWEEVAAGRTLGLVTNSAGGDPLPIPAARAGRVAMLRTAPPVEAGEYVAVVVPV